MRTILITGGTSFVSGQAALYFSQRGDHVYVLNRGSKAQPPRTKLIQADRHDLHDQLRGLYFDAVLDITAYTADDVDQLLDAVGGYGSYLLISSSAVYPDSALQPCLESSPVGGNRFWGEYGLNKIQAERALMARDSEAYILRPPYLYGPGNNLYREAFVFDCARKKRLFYLPKNGEMKLQFFHVHDLCRLMDILLEKKPEQHIFNVGNQEAVSVADWVHLCYQAAGENLEVIPVFDAAEQRNYFPFYNYEYFLDVQAQKKWLPETNSLQEGIAASYQWYLAHPDDVKKKPLTEYIDQNLRKMK